MSDAPNPDDLKKAFKAFKKRLKLTQLGEDSKISGSPLTGQHAKIVAIMPPNQFPQAVWDELARQGKLKRGGGGLFQLAEE